VVGISVAVGVQWALIAGFSIRAPLTPRTGPNTRLNLPAAVPAELQALTDPTLLALGGPRSFSAIWMEIPQLPPVDATWKQPPQWLDLDAAALGAAFLEYARSNATPVHGLAFKPPPRAIREASVVTALPLRSASSLQIAGDLGDRKLLADPELPSWPATDLLLPSEVRVVVDSRGIVISAILQSGSGLPQADEFAVKQARQLRFAPLRQGETSIHSLTLGRLLFNWHATQVPDKTTEPPARQSAVGP
jgi:hypothetical protein